jgi:hypothetical protein
MMIISDEELKALKLVEVVAPCILWVDEIEKWIAGAGVKSSDTLDILVPFYSDCEKGKWHS